MRPRPAKKIIWRSNCYRNKSIKQKERRQDFWFKYLPSQPTFLPHLPASSQEGAWLQGRWRRRESWCCCSPRTWRCLKTLSFCLFFICLIHCLYLPSLILLHLILSTPFTSSAASLSFSQLFSEFTILQMLILLLLLLLLLLFLLLSWPWLESNCCCSCLKRRPPVFLLLMLRETPALKLPGLWRHKSREAQATVWSLQLPDSFTSQTAISEIKYLVIFYMIFHTSQTALSEINSRSMSLLNEQQSCQHLFPWFHNDDSFERHSSKKFPGSFITFTLLTVQKSLLCILN